MNDDVYEEFFKNRTTLISGNLIETISGAVTTTLNNTHTLTVSGDNIETYNSNKTVSINGDNKLIIKGENSLTVDGVNTEIYKSNRNITISGDYTETITGERKLTIEDTNVEIYNGNRSIIISGNLVETITGRYDLQIKDVTENSLNINSDGGILFKAGNAINQEILINSNTRFNDLVYYTPQIISMLDDGNGPTAPILIENKVLTIISLVGGDNISIYLKLEKGIYNGQIKKIALHPMWAGNNVNIEVKSFCDTDGNYNNDTPVTLILNKGGQTLNLLYINSNLDEAYWMLLDNNFDFV